MKTILVLTDLSKKAENAANYAYNLAERMKANIILYHSFIALHSVAVPETGMWSVDDYDSVKEDSLNELKKLAEIIEKKNTVSKFKPAIRLLNGLGDLASNVKAVVRDSKIDLIVMGAKSDDVISHLFFGSETSNVLEESACPILFIPAKAFFEPFKTVIFSTDQKKAYPKAINFLIDLARIDQSAIIVTHVGEEGNFNQDQCLSLIKTVFEYPNATFKQIPGDNIADKLRSFIDSADADLVVMIHHQHILFGNLIPGGNSKKMLNHHQSPLLILPD